MWTERTLQSSLANIGKETSARYDGEMPDSDRWTSVATLKSTLWCTGSQCSWRSTGVMWSERRVPVTRRAAAFWTYCNRFNGPSEIHTEKQSFSSLGDRRRTPEPMFYWHLQTMTGQPAVAGAAGSRHFDRPQRREPTVTVGHILFRVLWNQTSISDGFRDIQRRNATVHATLIRPLNKGHGHSFWYQSISHIRLTIGCQYNFCSRTHRLATIHILSFFLSSRYGQTSTSWWLLDDQRLRTCRQCWEHNKRLQVHRCMLIRIEMNVSGSSPKGRDSLSPQPVEYLRYSSYRYITPELFTEYCTDSRQFQSMSVR